MKFIAGVNAIVSVVNIARKNHICHSFQICNLINKNTSNVPISTVAIMYKNDVVCSSGGLLISWFAIIIGLNCPVALS
jgi:hypothetical protein